MGEKRALETSSSVNLLGYPGLSHGGTPIGWIVRPSSHTIHPPDVGWMASSTHVPIKSHNTPTPDGPLTLHPQPYGAVWTKLTGQQ